MKQRYLSLRVALLVALLLVGSRYTGGTARAMATWLPAAVPPPGPGAMSIYSVSNGTASPISVRHDFVDKNGSTIYTFTASVPAHGTADYHVRDMTGLPSPFDGSVNLSADVPFTAQVTGYDYPSQPSQPQVTLLPQPMRLVDTRASSGYQGQGQALTGYTSYRRFTLAGSGGIPANATAVLVNLTAVGYSTDGWLAAYPACTATPETSNVNFDVDENAIANFALVRLGLSSSGAGCQGAIDVTGSAGTNVIVDAIGYLVATTNDQVVLLGSPRRMVDTRAGSGKQGAGTAIPANPASSRFVLADPAGTGAIPASATAVLVNLTAAGYRGNGWVAAYPACTAWTGTSNLNFDTDENAIANFAVIKLGAASAGPGCQGAIDVTAANSTDVIVDAVGYVVAASDQIVLLNSPARIVDTRAGSGKQGSDQPLQGIGAPRCYPVAGQGGVPSDAKGAIINLTGVGYARDGWIVAYPNGEASPPTSSVNYDTQENAIANTAVVRLGTGGQVCLVSSGPTNAIIDVAGYLK